jgi:hypothetical protein
MMVLRLSALRTCHHYHAGSILCTHFSECLSRPQCLSAAGRIMSMKNSNTTIGNWTRYLPTCSAVPQPTTTYPPLNYVCTFFQSIITPSDNCFQEKHLFLWPDFLRINCVVWSNQLDCCVDKAVACACSVGLFYCLRLHGRKILPSIEFALFFLS